MEDPAFWEIIEAARGDAEAVQAELSKRSLEDIAAWHRAYYDHHNALHRGELWDVADIIHSNLFSFPSSDDSFHYFKAWIIGKGREAYETALTQPDELDRFITEIDLSVSCDNESLNYAAEQAWEAGGRGYDELDRKSNEQEKPTGERCEPEDWPRRFPNLVRRFGLCRWS